MRRLIWINVLVVAADHELDDFVAASAALREGLDEPAVAEDGAFVGESGDLAHAV